ncbi:sce7726 family protein [Tenacibaculum sp. 190524A02b]|uniref:sce7726 family protein n=1 Tax=Tenacibaculum vairaonense TaxID=3137860 RepID=UPI0031FA79C9
MNTLNLSNTMLLKRTSPVLSNSLFGKLSKGDGFDYLERRVENYLSSNKNLNLDTYLDFYNHLYLSMVKNYRNEFIYKNEIVNKILLGKYSLNTANALNEFRIGKSIADLVLLNGTSVVFEIKTEYDSPERLLNQIQEYRKSFLNIVIVTHHSVIGKYQKFIRVNKLQCIGLMVLTENHTLKEVQKPIEDSSYLDITYMFKCLRKNEYTSIIKKYFGYIPNVPNTKLFRECLALANKMEEIDFHDFMFKELKKRQIKEKIIVSSREFPVFLKHISLCLDFSKQEINQIYQILTKKL